MTSIPDDFADAISAEAERLWPLDVEYTDRQKRATFGVRELDAYCASAFKRGARYAAELESTQITVAAIRELLETTPDVTQPEAWWPLGADDPNYREGAVWVESWWRTKLSALLAADRSE
jgi:hypothetical protein